ncbi:hypothetical protein DdX_14750 [Ditylenchus destructor]|uniref:Helitron helicase-like domain-containing protein n=1 Tax=Ditylenchus destructor TaxID=166010 RepID=A0AAD4MS77_9BILA|nr:hypothetical protein DdX_14750 [Ditylenchus destructor]
MPPKRFKPQVPMETRSRAKAKNNAEIQPEVDAKRIRKDSRPVPVEDGSALCNDYKGEVPAKPQNVYGEGPCNPPARGKADVPHDKSYVGEGPSNPPGRGSFDFPCVHCGALHFENEANQNELKKNKTERSYDDCCSHGKIIYEDSPPFPNVLKSLFLKQHPRATEFIENIRNINASFGFVSINAHVKNLRGQYHYRIQGPLYHLFNHKAHPIPGTLPSYGQLFFLDTNQTSDIRANNPLNARVSQELFREIKTELRNSNNQLIKSYQMMYEVEKQQNELARRNNIPEKKVTLVFDRKARTRNDLPPAESNEVAAIYVTNSEGEVPRSYVTVYQTSGSISQFSTLSEFLDPMTYPLIYPRGETGWTIKMPYQNPTGKRKNISRREFIKFHAAFRPLNMPDSRFNPVHFAEKLLHQWGVDMWTRVEGDLLKFQELKNKSMKSAKAFNVRESLNANDTNDVGLAANTDEISKRVILYSDYQGSIRFYQEEFRRSMIMAKRFGPPDLFITITFGSDNEDLKKAINIELEDGQSIQQQSNFRPDMKAYADIANLFFTERGEPITSIYGMPEPDMTLNDVAMNIDNVQHKETAETMVDAMNEKQKQFFEMLTQNQRVDPDEIEFLETLKQLGDGELQDGDEGYFEFPEECLSNDLISDVYGSALATKNYDEMH